MGYPLREKEYVDIDSAVEALTEENQLQGELRRMRRFCCWVTPDSTLTSYQPIRCGIDPLFLKEENTKKKRTPSFVLLLHLHLRRLPSLFLHWFLLLDHRIIVFVFLFLFFLTLLICLLLPSPLFSSRDRRNEGALGIGIGERKAGERERRLIMRRRMTTTITSVNTATTTL